MDQTRGTNLKERGITEEVGGLTLFDSRKRRYFSAHHNFFRYCLAKSLLCLTVILNFANPLAPLASVRALLAAGILVGPAPQR
jgi:hypothetical protein